VDLINSRRSRLSADLASIRARLVGKLVPMLEALCASAVVTDVSDSELEANSGCERLNESLSWGTGALARFGTVKLDRFCDSVLMVSELASIGCCGGAMNEVDGLPELETWLEPVKLDVSFCA